MGHHNRHRPVIVIVIVSVIIIVIVIIIILIIIIIIIIIIIVIIINIPSVEGLNFSWNCGVRQSASIWRVIARTHMFDALM